MGRIRDLAGQRFGRLIALDIVSKSKNRHMMWLCECDCGKEVIVRGPDLTGGKQLSCGCYRAEVSSQKAKTHGDSSTRLYRIWFGMLQRCELPTNAAYKNYGGRGISVIDDWHNYETFRDWAKSHGYNDTLTIERIDVNGNYEPQNCKWIPPNMQGRNTRKNRLFTLEGETLPMVVWAERLGMGGSAIKSRIERGYSDEEAITIPQMKPQALRYIEFQNRRQTVAQWSRELGIPSATIRRRIDVFGWSEVRALSVEVGAERSRNRLIEFDGKTQNITEWSKETGIQTKTIADRIDKSGWSIDKALSTPARAKNKTIIKNITDNFAQSGNSCEL